MSQAETRSGLRREMRFNLLAGNLICTCRGYEVYDILSPSFARYLETLEVVHQASFVAKLQAGDPSGLVDSK